MTDGHCRVLFWVSVVTIAVAGFVMLAGSARAQSFESIRARHADPSSFSHWLVYYEPGMLIANPADPFWIVPLDPMIAADEAQLLWAGTLPRPGWVSIGVCDDSQGPCTRNAFRGAGWRKRTALQNGWHVSQQAPRLYPARHSCSFYAGLDGNPVLGMNDLGAARQMGVMEFLEATALARIYGFSAC